MVDQDILKTLQKQFKIKILSDVEYMSVDTEELYYYCNNKINFALPINLHTLYLSCNYKHSLDFLTNTLILTLGIYDVYYSLKLVNLFDNIPYTIQILKILHLHEPLLNIPLTIEQITICDNPPLDLILKSKIPYNCEVFYGDDMIKYVE